MKRLLTVLALVALLAGFALAQNSQLAAGRAKSEYIPPRVISTVEPVYPPNVLAWGTVVLEVTVSESGGIAEVKVLSGLPRLPGLVRESERAVKLWKFEPARWNGKPIRATVPVAFTYSRGTFPPAP